MAKRNRRQHSRCRAARRTRGSSSSRRASGRPLSRPPFVSMGRGDSS
jgi:hypothetical protein